MSIKGKLAQLGIVYVGSDGLLFKKPVTFAGGSISPIGDGKLFFVDAENGSDYCTGYSPGQALATIAAAFAKCTEDKNDTIVLIGSSTAFTIADTLAWNKRHTHMIGIAAPTPNARARIDVSGTDSATAGIVVSVDGCMFANFRIFQSTSIAGSGAIEVTGSMNYFNNVDIQGQAGTLARASATAYSLKLNGAEECRFEQCTIGLDTTKRTDGQILLMDGGCIRNEFLNCFFRSYCETAAKVMVKINDAATLDRSLLFENCKFYNFYEDHGGTLNECFSIPVSCQTHDIILINSWLIGIAEWDANDRGQMWISMPVPTAEDGGVVVAPVNT